MKDLAWCTDIHLDFLDRSEEDGRIERELVAPILDSNCSGVMITGDISISETLCQHLALLDGLIKKPIYFVLGNHDFYGGSFSGVRSAIADLCSRSKNLKYLTNENPLFLSDRVALIGHDGWYDGLYGDPIHSGYIMTDWIRIDDFFQSGAIRPMNGGLQPNLNVILSVARHAAFEASKSVLEKGRAAAQKSPTVVVLTHVPPFPELHRPDNKSSSVNGMPWYTSKMMGDALRQLSREFPDTRFEVFSGHTHGLSSERITRNLTCHVGGATYDQPSMVGTIRII